MFAGLVLTRGAGDWRAGGTGSAGLRGERCCHVAQGSSTLTHLPTELPSPGQWRAALSSFASPASRAARVCGRMSRVGWERGPEDEETRGPASARLRGSECGRGEWAPTSWRGPASGLGTPDCLYRPASLREGLKSQEEVWTQCSRKEGVMRALEQRKFHK